MSCRKESEERQAAYKANGKMLNQLIKLSFEEKLKLTQQTIKDALSISEKPVIASSFGKDSMALIHLVHSVDDSVPIMFTETGVQFRETLRYKDRMIKEWGLEVHTLKPKETFWQIVKRSGYPKESRNSKTGDRREPKCCKGLKHDPMMKFVREFQPDMIFVGLIGDEGRQRRWPYVAHGSAIYPVKYLGVTDELKARKKCIPILWWVKADVWHYHDLKGIPRNPVYAKYNIERTGCIPCTGHIGWQEQLCRTFPKLYKRIQNDIGVTLITDFIEKQKAEAQ